MTVLSGYLPSTGSLICNAVKKREAEKINNETY